MTLKRILSTLLCAALCFTAAEAKKKSPAKTSEERPAVCVWNFDKMVEARADIRKNDDRSQYKAPYDRLIATADKLMSAKPVTVMDNDANRLVKPEMLGASKHDYINTSKYVWPDGKGWLATDEKKGVNTDWRNYSSAGQSQLEYRLKTLGLAYFFSGDEKYAEKAVEFARVWYLDLETRMNPHYRYGAVYPVKDQPGVYEERPVGLINAHNQTYAMAGLSLIRASKAYTPEFDKGMREWVGQLYTWMTTSAFGLNEAKGNSNRSVAYDQVVLSLALFMGYDAEARRIVDTFPERRIFRLIEPNGEQPVETWRTSGYHYSEYNITHLLEICNMAMEIAPRLYYADKEGRSIENGLKFLLPYLCGPREAWLATTGKKGKNFTEYADGTFESTQIKVACAAYRAHSFSPQSEFMEVFEKQKKAAMSEERYAKYRYYLNDSAILYITQ